MLRSGQGNVLRLVAAISCLLTVPTVIGASVLFPTEPRTLYLEVFVNDVEAGFVARFVETGDGDLLADADELRNVGVEPGRERSGDVRLGSIGGASFLMDEATQRIFFDLQNGARAPHLIDALSQDHDADPDGIDSGYGLVINYALDFEHVPDRSPVAAGFFDSRLYSPVGTLNHGFSLSDTGDDVSYRRLETYWRTPLAKRALQFQIGDMVSRGPEWAHPVRLGGFQIQRNFALRPDLVTMPLPSYTGSAAVPSTVEVYADSLRRFTTDVPEGPFELSNLPLASGMNEATIVVTDATGRQVRQVLPFVVTPNLLRKGLADYSLSFGYPRFGFGTEDDQYGDTLYGVAALRYGLNNNVTLTAYAEHGGGLKMAGLGAAFRLGTGGTASATAAFSNYEGQEGQLTEIASDLRFGELRLTGRIMHSDSTFIDIARLTTPNSADVSTAPSIKDLKQLTLSIPIGGAWNAIGVKYIQAERLDGRRENSFGLMTARKFGERSSIYLSALAVRTDTEDDFRVSAGLHIPLGGRVHGDAGVALQDGAFTQSISVSRGPDAKQKNWDWRMRVVRDDGSRVMASAGREFGVGRVDVALRADEDGLSTGLRLDGALALAGGGAFLSKRIDDAFVVVDTGAPGVKVAIENRRAGTTGPSGKLLIPGLRSYHKNAISIDPVGLPVEATIGMTNDIVTPAYHNGVRLDFDIDISPKTAIVYLTNALGQPVQVGLTAILDETGESQLVGYDGMVFLSGLQQRNQLTVIKLDGKTCKAEFSYQSEMGSIPEIRDVLCL